MNKYEVLSTPTNWFNAQIGSQKFVVKLDSEWEGFQKYVDEKNNVLIVASNDVRSPFSDLFNNLFKFPKEALTPKLLIVVRASPIFLEALHEQTANNS